MAVPPLADVRWSRVAAGGDTGPAEGVDVLGCRLERRLGRHALGDRWLARRLDGRRTPAVIYRLDRLGGARSPRRFKLAADMLLTLVHPHVLAVEAVDAETGGERWLRAPFVGSCGDLCLMRTVVKHRDGGRLTPMETRWVVSQVLSASAYAHGRGVCHGRITLDDLVIDTRGSVVVELYGLGSRLRGVPAGDRDAERAEVRSVASLAAELAGAPGDDERDALLRAIGGELGREFRDWSATVLDGGFASASAALGALDECRRSRGEMRAARSAGEATPRATVRAVGPATAPSVQV